MNKYLQLLATWITYFASVYFIQSITIFSFTLKSNTASLLSVTLLFFFTPGPGSRLAAGEAEGAQFPRGHRAGGLPEGHHPGTEL